MKINLTRALTLWMILNSYPSFASPPKCEVEEQNRQNTILTRYELIDKNCGAGIDPNYALSPNLVYRSYSIGSMGDFFIFNSYGEGPNSVDTSSKIYFFFPRTEKMSAKFSDENHLVVHTPWGSDITFNSKTARIESMSGIDFEEDAQVDRRKQGGVTLKNYRGLMLDTGYRVGDISYGNPKWKSTFIDRYRKTCTVENDEIFSYDGNARLKHSTDIELKAFLRARCPHLSLRGL